MANTLNERSVKEWRALGFVVDSVEQYVRIPGKNVGYRKDLYGFVDLVAVGFGRIVFIQTTAWDSVSARLKKMREETTGRGQFATPIRRIVREILRAGVEIRVEGWRVDPKSNRYEVKIHDVTLAEAESWGD